MGQGHLLFFQLFPLSAEIFLRVALCDEFLIFNENDCVQMIETRGFCDIQDVKSFGQLRPADGHVTEISGKLFRNGHFGKLVDFIVIYRDAYERIRARTRVTQEYAKVEQAIDVHGHYGRCVRGESERHMGECMSGSAETVLARAKRARVEWTVVSPLTGLLPRGGADPVKGNEEASRLVDETDGLLQWVIVDPLKPETYEQARDRFASTKCVGIKIHPDEHIYLIREHGDTILSFAAEHRAVVLTHSGGPSSGPADFLPFADAYPEAVLVLAHTGNSEGGDLTEQVQAITAAKHGNVYADTSSARSVYSGLIEWAVRTAGAERILFGSDTPLYSVAAQRARIDGAEMSAQDKRKVLRDNAERLLRLPDCSASAP